jgi:hypothetical protein
MSTGDPGWLPINALTMKKAERHFDAGDQLVLWRAGPESGIYALGMIQGAPRPRPDPEETGLVGELPWRVAAILDPPLLRERVEMDPVLRGLSILRGGGFNFRVTDRQWDALLRLVGL